MLDIGSGPGVGTCELARLFPEAQVIALDGSPATLARVRQRADAHGLGDRIRTHHTELPGGLDALEPVDVIWASMALHHVGDEVALLRALHDLLEPAGIIAIAEVDEPMRVLPDALDVGRPGLAERLAGAGRTWFAIVASLALFVSYMRDNQHLARSTPTWVARNIAGAIRVRGRA